MWTLEGDADDATDCRWNTSKSWQVEDSIEDFIESLKFDTIVISIKSSKISGAFPWMALLVYRFKDGSLYPKCGRDMSQKRCPLSRIFLIILFCPTPQEDHWSHLSTCWLLPTAVTIYCVFQIVFMIQFSVKVNCRFLCEFIRISGISFGWGSMILIQRMMGHIKMCWLLATRSIKAITPDYWYTTSVLYNLRIT